MQRVRMYLLMTFTIPTQVWSELRSMFQTFIFLSVFPDKYFFFIPPSAYQLLA